MKTPHITYGKSSSERLMEFINEMLNGFYENMSKLNKDDLRITLSYGTEATLRHHLLKNLESKFPNEIMLFPELGIEYSDSSYGFADVIFALKKELLFVLETKTYWASVSEPESGWDSQSTHNFYNRALAQPRKYIKGIKPIDQIYARKYIGVLYFARLDLRGGELHADWVNFASCDQDEFYSYSEMLEGEYGISVYGKIQEVIL